MTYTTLPVPIHLMGALLISAKLLNLNDIHNNADELIAKAEVVNLLQSYAFLMKYTKKIINICTYQKKAVPLHQLNLMTYTIRIIPLCKHSEWHASVALFFASRLIAL